jgi:large subunit ribosomal protein L28
MAICIATGRHARSGNNRSHALNITKRQFKANLKKITIELDNGKKETAYVSVRALKVNPKTGKSLLDREAAKKRKANKQGFRRV